MERNDREKPTVKVAESDEELRGKAFVHWKTWHEAYAGIVRREYLDKLTLAKCEEIALTWRENTLVALDRGRVVGFACYGKNDELDFGEIVALYILPAYYGTGLGQALLDAACERLTGYGRIRLDVLEKNARAIRFYEKNGFVPDGRRTESPSLGAVVIGMSRKGI